MFLCLSSLECRVEWGWNISHIYLKDRWGQALVAQPTPAPTTAESSTWLQSLLMASSASLGHVIWHLWAFVSYQHLVQWGRAPGALGPSLEGSFQRKIPCLTLGGYLPACGAWLFPQNMQFCLWEKLLLLGDLGQPLLSSPFPPWLPCA